MSASGSGDEWNVSIGQMSGGQVAVGHHNVLQNLGISKAELQQLESAFGELRSTVANEAPPEQRQAALEQVQELEHALITDKPEAGRVRRVKDWFMKNLPQLAGAVTSVVIHPIVGKIVTAAGDAIAAEFGDLLRGD